MSDPVDIRSVGGYKLTQRACTEAAICGLNLKTIKHILSHTIRERRAVNSPLWLVTDGHNTALIAPEDSLLVSVTKGVV